MFTLSVATATVSVDTMEFGQPNRNHHINMFALSVATATVSVDTMELSQPNKNVILTCLHLALLLQPLESTRESFYVHIYNVHIQCAYTKLCYCNS